MRLHLIEPRQSYRSRILRTALAVALIVGLSTTARAQPKSILDKTVFVDYSARFHADAYVVPTDDPDSAAIVVFFRMSNDFLTFTKVSSKGDVRGNFIATMAVSVEVRDTMGVIRQRIRWENTAYTNTFDETNNKNIFRYGWQRVVVPPGTYAITLEILEKKESPQKRIKLDDVSYNPRKSRRLLTSPMFAEPVPSKDRTLLRPYVFSGNVLFGSRDAVALILLSDSTPVRYDYVIKQTPYGARDIRWWSVSDIEGEAESSNTRHLRLSEFANTKDPFLEVFDDEANRRKIALVELPLSVSNLVPGNYSIQLVAQGTTDTLRMPFSIQWEMMPLSLRNIDYAMAVLKYILTPSQLDSLDSGNDIERRERLMSWWRKQDPTPTTTFNERMAEYYKRVDQAFFAFSTIQESDGADTERAKIYVLFGPPTKVDKNLSPNNEPQEIWTYTNSVKKIFTFKIDDSGIYKLKKIDAVE